MGAEFSIDRIIYGFYVKCFSNSELDENIERLIIQEFSGHVAIDKHY